MQAWVDDDKIRQTVASQAAGAIATGLVYPLDTLRIRYMSQDKTGLRLHNGVYYRNMGHSARLVWRDEGCGGFFRGLHMAVAGATMSWGIYMWSYRWLQDKARLAFMQWEEGGRALGTLTGKGHRDAHSQRVGSSESYGRASKRFFALDSAVSMLASCFNAVVTTPVWHVKTRMQVEDIRPGQPRVYSSAYRTVRRIVDAEGLGALWLGSQMQIAMSATNAFYLPLYEFLRQQRLAHKHRGAVSDAVAQQRATTELKVSLSNTDIIACSATSKTLIAVLTNPLFVIRTRLQDARRLAVEDVKYTGTWAAVRLMAQREGLQGIFRGVGPSVWVTAPRSALCMILMERILEALPGKRMPLAPSAK